MYFQQIGKLDFGHWTYAFHFLYLAGCPQGRRVGGECDSYSRESSIRRRVGTSSVVTLRGTVLCTNFVVTLRDIVPIYTLCGFV